MSRFSERAGIKAPKTAIQIDSIDDELRTALWSAYHLHIASKDVSASTSSSSHAQYYQQLYLELFKAPIDKMPWQPHQLAEAVRKWFFAAPWHDVYDFIEFTSQHGPHFWVPAFRNEVNRVLIREVAGYRLVDGLIVPISDVTEINAVSDALDATQSPGLKAAQIHLRTALAMLSSRKEPDYRNSVKESISAVESIAKLLAGSPKAELADAMRILESKAPLHGALRKGFLALYGYTSDADGIRHALLDAPSVDFVDAKYMLVTCSAFVHFLVARAAEAGVTIK